MILINLMICYFYKVKDLMHLILMKTFHNIYQISSII